MNFKRYLIAGIATAVPLAVTVYILIVLIKLFDGLSQPLLTAFLGQPVPGLGLLVTAAILTLLGMFVSFAVGRKTAELVDQIMLKIPLSRSIYSVAKNVIDTFFSGRKEFGAVVLVQLLPEVFTIGFLTGDTSSSISSSVNRKLVNVFVPTSPNPMTGFLLMISKDHVTDLGMTFDKGMELIVSAGMCASENGKNNAKPHDVSGLSFTDIEKDGQK